MPIVDVDVSGRTGLYNVTIFDIENLRSPFNVELENDLIIGYGELKRQPLVQILKSWVQLAFRDETLELHKEFRGGFAPRKYLVEIDGPGVLWRGLVKKESRTIPFSQRTQVERTVLNCYGGITKDRLTVPTEGILGDASGAFFDDLLVQGIVFGDDEIYRSDVQLVDRDGITKDLSDRVDSLPLNITRKRSIYDAFIEYAKTTKAMLYRSLSEGALVIDSARLIGSGGTVQRRTRDDRIGSGLGGMFDFGNDDPQLSDFSDYEREEKVVTIDEFVIERDSDGLEDLDRAAVIRVELEQEGNLIQPGSSTLPGTSFAGWKRDSPGTSTLDTYFGTDITKFVVVVPDGTVELFLGEITPTQSLALLVTWENVTGSPGVTLKYRGDDGSTESVSDASTKSGIIGPVTTDRIDPVIEVSGSTSDEIEIKARYVDTNERIIETLIADSEDKGVDDITIKDVVPPLVLMGAVDITEAKSIKIPGLSIDNNQPWLVRSSVERAYRPFGTQTARGKLFGVHGPENVFFINDDDGTPYIATGLEVNLTTGITDVALVEVPPHLLEGVE